MEFRVPRASCLLAGCLLLAACAPTADVPQRSLRAQGRPIYYGDPDTSAAHQAVVALTEGPGTDYFCSGTLIAPRIVLTAGHCLEGVGPTWLEIFFGQDAYDSGQYRAVANVVTHPDYDSWEMFNDIGLIVLAADAPAGVTPIPALPSGLGLSSADIGTAVDFSGFGLTETGTDGVKLHMDASIGFVCPGPSTCDYYGADVVAFAFAYSQATGGPCSGDSGGPAFILRGGTEYVAGVTSYGDEGCTDYGVSTTVDAFSDWIAAFIAGGGLEDCDQAGDEDVDGRADCADADCATHPDCAGQTACGQAASVACGARLDGDTAGGISLFGDYGCLVGGTEDGPELAFRVDAPAGTQVVARMQPTGSGDLDLLLLPAAGAGCDPAACLDASVEENPNDEVLTFTVPQGGVFLVVETWDSADSFHLELDCNGTAELCDNGFDDDEDGATDCDDTECIADPACSTSDEDCHNGVDDDGDGVTDCADSECAPDPQCQSEGGCGCGGAAGGAAGWPLLALALLRRRRARPRDQGRQ